MCLHVGTQKLVDLGLVTLALLAEERDDVLVDAKGYLLFGGCQLEPFSDDRVREHFRSHLGQVGEVYILGTHAADALPISLGFL